MTRPVNLNKLRKARARAEARAKADENARRFGEPKDRKTLRKTQEAARLSSLDGHKRDR